MWDRINEMRSQAIPAQEQLKELSAFKSQMKSCIQPGDTLYALLLQRIGVQHFQISDYTHAIDATQTAINVLNSGNKNYKARFLQLVNCYGNLAYYFDALGLMEEKQNVYDSCINISISHKIVSEPLLDVIESRTAELVKLGDYDHCIRIARVGESMAEEAGLTNSYSYKKININKLNALIELDRLDEAQTELSKRIQFYELARDTSYLGISLIQQGNIMRRKGNFSRALDFYNSSYVYNKAANNLSGCASSLNSIGFVYSDKLHDTRSALLYFQLALRYNDPSESLSILDNVANLYAYTNEFDSSLHYFSRALETALPGMTEYSMLDSLDRLLSYNKAEYVITLCLDKADVWMKWYQADSQKAYLDSALSIFHRTDLALDILRRNYAGNISKLFWRNNTHRLYEHAIEASQRSGNLDAAFYYFEKSRAALLNEALVDQRWLGAENIARETALKKDLLYLQRNLALLADSLPRFKTLQQEIYSKTQELVQLQRDIKVKNPIFYQNFLDTSMVRLQDFKNLLQLNDQWMVEVFTGDSAMYILTLTRTSGWIKKLDRQEYNRLALSYISYLENPTAMNGHFQDFQETSGHLYKFIFGQGSLPAGRMIISQDAQYFPFEALINSANVSGPHYLVEDYPMSYTYSARYLMSNLAFTTKSGGEQFLGFAPVQFGSQKLADLPASDVSLKKLGNFFGDANLLVGPKATRNQFMDQFYRYNIIQLYTHGADSGMTGEPVIYFADSALFLSDLIGDEKPLTRLIVLSACETGTGKLYRGEGIFSFNRGFAALGIPSSITNLWSVNNEATYKITELFYQYIAKGIPTDIALQKAKQEYLHSANGEMKLPNFWAAPILVGNIDEFKIERGLNWQMIVLGAGAPLLLVILVAWYINRRRKAAASI